MHPVGYHVKWIGLSDLAIWLLLCFVNTVHRYRIGSLPNHSHGIQGTLYAQGSAGTTIVITNFHYDGYGPDAYLYVYLRGATVSASGGGVIIPLSATWVLLLFAFSKVARPVHVCCVHAFCRQTKFAFGRRYSGETLIAHITDGSSITDYGTFTIWCQAASVFFTRINIPTNLFSQVCVCSVWLLYDSVNCLLFSGTGYCMWWYSCWLWTPVSV